MFQICEFIVTCNTYSLKRELLSELSISPATHLLKSDKESVTCLSTGVGTIDQLSFEGLKKKKRFLLYVNVVNMYPPLCVLHIMDDGE